jgi:hypothetical protein
MRHWCFVLVIGLMAAACGVEHPAAIEPTTTTAASIDPAFPEPVPADDRLEPGSQPASRSPVPMSEPILVPVPAAAPEPTKPFRPALPTPPPPRSVPVDAEPIGPSADAIAGAVADLARRLGLTEEAIAVLDARQVTWRNGSIGCPEPGLAYTEAEIQGELIVLRAGDSSYRYHAAEGAPFFYCKNPQSPMEGGG